MRVLILFVYKFVSQMSEGGLENQNLEAVGVGNQQRNPEFP